MRDDCSGEFLYLMLSLMMDSYTYLYTFLLKSFTRCTKIGYITLGTESPFNNNQFTVNNDGLLLGNFVSMGVPLRRTILLQINLNACLIFNLSVTFFPCFSTERNEDGDQLKYALVLLSL